MVFIKSQEYTNPFGKKSKNIICLEGQTDYRMSLNPETNKFDVSIVIGDYEKYIFSTDKEDDVDRIMQNVLTQHATKEPHLIYDINTFMITRVNEEATLEEIEDMISDVLNLYGYNVLDDVWRSKIEIGVEESTSPIMIINEGKVSVNNIQIDEDETTTQQPYYPITSYEPYQIAQATIKRDLHYQ